MLKQLLEFRKTDRKWHLPVVAGWCVGLPVLAGYYAGYLADGKLASMAALVILYTQSQSLVNRMIILMACSFGFMLSFGVGLLFSFDPFVAPLVLAFYAFAVHLALYYLKIVRPPGNFFFIMLASVAICQPFEPALIPHKIGLAGIGTIIACGSGLIYSLLTLKVRNPKPEVIQVTKNPYVNFIESITYGFFVGLALLVGNLLELENPYWLPTSCAAVMQGISSTHVWQRSIQRISGTFLGLVLTWGILLLNPSLLQLCLGIILLQIVVEFLIVRNYGVAVIFITVLTIFLAETGTSLTQNPTHLIQTRFLDILIGSIIGGIGGWVLFNEKLQFLATRQFRVAKLKAFRRRS